MFPLIPSVKNPFTYNIARKEEAILLQTFIKQYSCLSRIKKGIALAIITTQFAASSLAPPNGLNRVIADPLPNPGVDRQAEYRRRMGGAGVGPAPLFQRISSPGAGIVRIRFTPGAIIRFAFVMYCPIAASAYISADCDGQIGCPISIRWTLQYRPPVSNRS